jgi:hypothetical protein
MYNGKLMRDILKIKKIKKFKKLKKLKKFKILKKLKSYVDKRVILKYNHHRN